MMMRSVKLWCCSLLILLTACQSGDEKKSSPVPPEAKKHPVAEKSVVQYIPVQPQSVPYKGQYCFIKNIYKQGDTTFIEAGYIQFLMNEEAVAAATKKGETGAAMDNYYIINDNTKPRILALSKGVAIFLIDPGNAKPVSDSIANTALYKQLKDGIYVLQVNNGLVTEIKQQFLP